jgi:hypothetical protein
MKETWFSTKYSNGINKEHNCLQSIQMIYEESPSDQNVFYVDLLTNVYVSAFFMIRISLESYFSGFYIGIRKRYQNNLIRGS